VTFACASWLALMTDRPVGHGLQSLLAAVCSHRDFAELVGTGGYPEVAGVGPLCLRGRTGTRK